MLKVSVEQINNNQVISNNIPSNIKDEIIVDPYIPIQVKFGNLYSWEDNRVFVRFTDMKYAMLEVGFLEESGVIRSINLLGAKEIYLNKEHDYNFENCEEGVIVLNKDIFEDKQYIDIPSDLVVSTWGNKVVLSFCNDEVVRFIQNGQVKFGLNKHDELCCFIVDGFSNDKMNKLNGCLEYMLDGLLN